MTVSAADLDYVREHVREVPDFPKQGILFIDVTTALQDARAWQISLDFMAENLPEDKPDYIVGMEARGFIYGAALAAKLGIGFVPVRKPGKLPAATISESYELEYGSDVIEMHKDALKPGDKVLLVDDLLATGGTAEAAAKLVRKAGAEVVGASFFVELPPLKGRAKLEAQGVKCISMLEYDVL